MTVIPQDPFGPVKPDDKPQGPSPQEVNTFHARDDLDSSTLAHHHTIGISRNQVSSGAHTHDGKNSKKLGQNLNLTVTTSSGTDAAKFASLVAMLHKVIDFDEI